MARTPMHEGEIPTDEALVGGLIARQFPHWAGLAVTTVPSAGTDNALYRLGTDMLVRLPRIDWAVDDVAKEQHWLPILATHLPVRVPTPLALGRPDPAYPYPWSVYDWLEGRSPGVDELEDPAALADDLADFVRALQGIDTTDAPRASRGGTLAERDGETRAALAALATEVDIGAVTAVWDDALTLPTWSDAPVWIHGDLAPGNLLCQGGHLRAVIDFGGMGVGDPAVDLLIAWTLLPARGRGVYRAALGTDDATWLRGRAWALSIALIQLPYYRDTNPALAASARHVVREVLADVRRSG